MDKNMDLIKNKLEAGEITLEQYREEAVHRSVDILISEGYHYERELGRGSFGAVVAMKSPQGHSKQAVKIVLRDQLSQSEVILWPTLKHENILPLTSYRYVPMAHSLLFFMPLHPQSLNFFLTTSRFLANKKSFSRAVTWMSDVLKGLEYLHSRNICHLDIKRDNVLISESLIAILCDFGFARSTKDTVNSYGSPLPLRPPEVCSSRGSRIAVDGQSFDMWTIGLLALETLTERSLLKSLYNSSIDSWSENVYPNIFDILQKKKFKNLVKKAFPASKISGINNILNFIITTLDIDPIKRLQVTNALNHVLFGGTFRGKPKHEIWIKKASPMRLHLLTTIYSKQAHTNNNSDLNMDEMANNETRPSIGDTTITENDKKAEEIHDNSFSPKRSRWQTIAQWMLNKRTATSQVFFACIPIRRRK